MVDGGGVAGSGRRGTTTAERLPAIEPSLRTPFLLLSGLRWKYPSKTKTKHCLEDIQYFIQSAFPRLTLNMGLAKLVQEQILVLDSGPNKSHFSASEWSTQCRSSLKLPKPACDIFIPTFLSPGGNTCFPAGWVGMLTKAARNCPTGAAVGFPTQYSQ